MNQATFIRDMRNRVDQSGRCKDVIIFIHGYNVDFAGAAKRAAQLAYDIQFDGVMSFFR